MRLDRSYEKTKQQKHNICMMSDRWTWTVSLGDLETIIMIMLDRWSYWVTSVQMLKMQRLTLTMSALWWTMMMKRRKNWATHIATVQMFKKTVWAISFSFCWRNRKRTTVTKQSQHICDLQEEIPWWVSNKKPSYDPEEMCESNLIFHLLFTLDTRDP